jgi:hypothetical protein
MQAQTSETSLIGFPISVFYRLLVHNLDGRWVTNWKAYLKRTIAWESPTQISSSGNRYINYLSSIDH